MCSIKEANINIFFPHSNEAQDMMLEWLEDGYKETVEEEVEEEMRGEEETGEEKEEEGEEKEEEGENDDDD